MVDSGVHNISSLLKVRYLKRKTSGQRNRLIINHLIGNLMRGKPLIQSDFKFGTNT